MKKFENLIVFYDENIRNKIFEFRDFRKNSYILFTYDYNSEQEKFTDTFLYYLPCYVKNKDQIEMLDFNDIFNDLKNLSLDIQRRSPIMTNRDIEVSGFYGELILDFYIRVIKKNSLLITYASKKEYKSNFEQKGYDSFAYAVKDNKIEFIISEVKFVADLSKAKGELIKDIKGDDDKVGHLTKDYFNDYLYFIIEKGNYPDKDVKCLQDLIIDLNKVAYKDYCNNEKNFIDYLIKKNIKFNFIFFALFQSNKKNIDDLIKDYESINEIAIKQANDMGITNYSIEIVFIPLKGKSITIKRGIISFYEGQTRVC